MVQISKRFWLQVLQDSLKLFTAQNIGVHVLINHFSGKAQMRNLSHFSDFYSCVYHFKNEIYDSKTTIITRKV